jgi:hypothetical protein
MIHSREAFRFFLRSEQGEVTHAGSGVVELKQKSPEYQFENTRSLFDHICRYWLAGALEIDVSDLRDDEVYQYIERRLRTWDPEPRALHLLEGLK